MTREQMREAARQLVADWPPPSPEQMAVVADLMRPFLPAASATPRIPRQRTTVRRAA